MGRRNPDRDDDEKAGPKYLNTAETTLYRKGDQLFVADASGLSVGATPVLVEGPMDAVAVTLAGRGAYVGVAPLGTSLTQDQARQLAELGRHPLVATDADLAGRVAAERHYWLLAQHGMTPTVAALPEGGDPASLLHDRGPDELLDTLREASPLAAQMIESRLDTLTGQRALREAVAVLAAAPPDLWDAQAQLIAERLGLTLAPVRAELAAAVRRWNDDPRGTADAHIADTSEVRERLAREADYAAAQETWRDPSASVVRVARGRRVFGSEGRATQGMPGGGKSTLAARLKAEQSQSRPGSGAARGGPAR